MIQIGKGIRGSVMVSVICDDCGGAVEVKQRGGDTLDGQPVRAANGAINSRIQKEGWRARGEKHTCPSCVKSKREKPEEAKLAQIPEPDRQPTRDQKREIMAMLQDVYDTKSQRYRGVETDKSVAETLGDGILWGWVANLREEFFGPDGNEEIDKLVAEVRDLVRRGDELHAKLHDDHAKVIAGMREMSEVKARLTALADKLSGQVKPRVVAVK